MKIKRFINKQGVRSLLMDFREMIPEGFLVVDTEEKPLFGTSGNWTCSFPFYLDGKLVGHVLGDPNSKIVAAALQSMADVESEKRSLARETLERYKELRLFYGLADKLASQMDSSLVGRIVLNETLRLIKADNASVMLVDSSGALEILAGAGSWSKTGKRGTIAGLGISGTILKSGKAEIVNDVHQDCRFLAGNMPIRSLMCAPLKIHDKCIGVINVSTLERHTYTAEDLKLLSSVAGQAAALIENAKLYGELQETFFSTVNVLAETIEMRDRYTGGHTRRVRMFSQAIGQELELTPEDLATLTLAASLHDIGKIGIDDDILRKPGALTGEEFAEIKRHPEYGAEILTHVKGLRHLVPIVRHHHERYDGLGYPDGLKNEEIPFLARIISVADAFDAMIIDRPYRKALTLQQALNELDGNRDTQFDGAIVTAFFKVFHAQKIGI